MEYEGGRSPGLRVWFVLAVAIASCRSSSHRAGGAERGVVDVVRRVSKKFRTCTSRCRRLISKQAPLASWQDEMP